MKQIQVAKASSAEGAERVWKECEHGTWLSPCPFCSGQITKTESIVQKMIGEVPDDLVFEEALGEIAVYARYVGCDVALELRGDRLWLWSIVVRG